MPDPYRRFRAAPEIWHLLERYDREEVNVKNMRKMFALAMVALLALTLAFAVVSCGKKAEETPAESTPPAESSMPMDSTMHSDSAMADTMAH